MKRYNLLRKWNTIFQSTADVILSRLVYPFHYLQLWVGSNLSYLNNYKH